MAKLNPVDASTPKLHPFSKEARALREEAKLQQPHEDVPEVIQTTTSTNVVPTTKEVAQPDLSDIIRRIEQVEAENKELKEKFVHPSVKGHEINNDPKQFSYKLRGGQPVLGRTSKKKDPAKDLIYKNEFGQYISNHLLELRLADGTTLDVEVNEFGIHHTKSQRMIARDQHGELIDNETLSRVKSLIFETEEFGKFTVDLAFIN